MYGAAENPGGGGPSSSSNASRLRVTYQRLSSSRAITNGAISAPIFASCASNPRRAPRDSAAARALSSGGAAAAPTRSEEHTSELQSRLHLVCRLLLEKKKE